MTLFNPVFDCVEKYKKKGKSQKWSAAQLNEKIIRSVMRRKQKYGEIYPQYKIDKFLYDSWAQRKNFNILWLEFYQYQQRKKAEQEEQNIYADVSEVDSQRSTKDRQACHSKRVFESNNNLFIDTSELDLLKASSQCNTESLQISDLGSQIWNVSKNFK